MRLAWEYPKGRVKASGLFFDVNLLSENSIMERVLSEWEIGSRAFKIESGYFLLWPESSMLFCHQAKAMPVFKYGSAYTNVILSDASSVALPKKDQLIIRRHGEEIITNLREDLIFDPSIWLNLNQYKIQVVESLGNAPSSPQHVNQPINKNVRDIVGKGKLSESSALKKTMAALDDIKEGRLPPNENQAGSSNQNLLGGLLSTFKSILTSSKKKKSIEGEQAKPPNYSNSNDSSESVLDKIKAAFSNFIMVSQLGKIIGRSQAKYLQEMMKKFDDGNLEEALKHAIPLSNLQDALKQARSSLGRPQARQNLSINTHDTGSNSSIHLEDQFLDKLRNMYEMSFRRLDAAAKTEEAAFVLAELLKDTDRAIHYLEKHQQFTLAAELAEGQKMSPARIVRQWVLAGNAERAMHIARIASCYQEAITALAQSHPAQADSLRWECACLHWDSGSYQAAIDIAWPLLNRRVDVLIWLKKSVSEGGEMGIRHMLKLAIFDTENSQYYFTLLNNTLKQQGNLSVQSKQGLVDELIACKQTKESRLAANLLSRYYLRDVSLGLMEHQAKRWRSLYELSGDLTLRADLRQLDLKKIPHIEKLLKNRTPKELVISSANGRAVQDIAMLRDGCLLLAFGESGVEYRNISGKLIHSHFIPCHKIIMSDHGSQALLLAERSGYQVVHHFNLQNNKVKHWLDLSITYWANTYDGLSWVVGKDDALWIIDTQSETQVSLWSIDKLEGQLVGIKRSELSFSFALQHNDSFEIWRYKLPDLFLKERTPYSADNLTTTVPTDYNENALLAGFRETQGAAANQISVSHSSSYASPVWVDLVSDTNPIQFICLDYWLGTVCNDSNNNAQYHLYNIADNKIDQLRLIVHFENAKVISARKFGDTLLIWHAEGRVCTIDLQSGKLISDSVI